MTSDSADQGRIRRFSDARASVASVLMPGAPPATRLSWAAVPLRLIIGYGFMAHGYAKLSRGPGGFADILTDLGVPFPTFMAWLTALVEFFGGLAILAGAFVVLVSVPLIISMLFAMFTVHLPNGFSSIKLKGILANGRAEFGAPGYEVNLLYIAGMLTLVLGGAGAFSVDRALGKRRARRQAERPSQPVG